MSESENVSVCVCVCTYKMENCVPLRFISPAKCGFAAIISGFSFSSVKNFVLW